MSDQKIIVSLRAGVEYRIEAGYNDGKFFHRDCKYDEDRDVEFVFEKSIKVMQL